MKFHVFLINNLKFPITAALNTVSFFNDFEIKGGLQSTIYFPCQSKDKRSLDIIKPKS